MKDRARPLHARLWSGVVRVGDTPAYFGRRVFFLDLVEADGGTFNIWDGLSYQEALREAAELGRDGCRVVLDVFDVNAGPVREPEPADLREVEIDAAFASTTTTTTDP